MTQSLAPQTLDKLDGENGNSPMGNVLGSILGTIATTNFDVEDNKGENKEKDSEKEKSEIDFKPQLTTDVEKLLNDSTDNTTLSTMIQETPNQSTLNETLPSHTDKSEPEKKSPKDEKTENPDIQLSSIISNTLKKSNKDEDEQKADDNTTLSHEILATGDLNISTMAPKKEETNDKAEDQNKEQTPETQKEQETRETDKNAENAKEKEAEAALVEKVIEKELSSCSYSSDEEDVDKKKEGEKTEDRKDSLMLKESVVDALSNAQLTSESDTTMDATDEKTELIGQEQFKKFSSKENVNSSHDVITKDKSQASLEQTANGSTTFDKSQESLTKTQNDSTSFDKTKSDTTFEKSHDSFSKTPNDGQDLSQTEVIADQVGTSSSSPHLPESCYLNLKGVNSLPDQSANGPTYTYSMPGGLSKIVYHSPDSLVCKALALYPLPPLTKDEKDSLISDLLKYTSICSEKGMIYEAAYVNQIKDTIRETPDFVTVKYDLKRTQESLNYAENEINAQKQFWENQRSMIQTEYETAMKELEMRYHQQQDMLDQEWQSTRKMQKYSKPSPQLLDLRYKTSRLISTKQFERAKQNGQKLAELEAIESEESTKRMNEAYRLADANLEKKYRADCEVLRSIRDKRMDAATHSEERAFKPVNRRYEKLSAEKARLQATHDRGLPIPGKQIPQFQQNCNLPFIDLNSTPKLNLKKVTLIKRKREDRSRNQTKQASNSRPQSAMTNSAMSTPKPLVYRGDRINRSPTRLGHRNE